MIIHTCTCVHTVLRACAELHTAYRQRGTREHACSGSVMGVMGVRGEGGDDKADKRQEGGWEESRLHCFPLVNVDVTYLK